MYSGENRDEFPPGTTTIPVGDNNYRMYSWLQGFGGEHLYPDYWNDVNIAICPSDSRADYDPFIDGNSGFGVEEDFAAQIEDLAQRATATGTDLCLNAYLSMPVSYVYTGYAGATGSQVMDIFFIRSDAWKVATEAAYLPKGDQRTIDAGCTAIGAAEYSDLNIGDIGDDQIAVGSPRDVPNTNSNTDDDGSRLPDSYQRLAEGVERFFITDINNPAGAAAAQSTLPVMFDSWSDSAGQVGWNSPLPAVPQATTTFNHIPGGSNVLYMDGHVEFVRYGSKFPVTSEAEHPEALTWAARGYMYLTGGFG
jgi:prepilin-type processing-associated H-X9-DG protein